MKRHKCAIYVLFDENGRVNYVGRSARPISLRIGEHRKDLGFSPKFKIIAYCSEDCREVERRWIARYRKKGFVLRNIYYGQGPHFMSAESRKKLSLIVKGRPVTWGDKISVAQKGIPKNWSRAGLRKQKRTWFKKDENSWTRLSRAAQKRMRMILSAKWKDPELRKRMSVGWKKALDPEVRARAGKSISIALKSHPRRARRIALAAAKKSIKPTKNFWAKLRKDPKRYRAFIAKREALRIAKLQAKNT